MIKVKQILFALSHVTNVNINLHLRIFAKADSIVPQNIIRNNLFTCLIHSNRNIQIL